MRQPISITDCNTWHEALTQLPNPQVLQSWGWGTFKSRWGWQPTRLLWRQESGLPIAAAQVLKRSIPKTPWHMFYAPRGPIFNYADQALARQVLQDLEAYAHHQNAIFIKIDPAVTLAKEPAESSPDPVGQAIQQLLRNRNWHYAPQQIQFKNTVMLDLASPEETLLQHMKPKWRYNIRLAKRKGVSVRVGGPADLDTFFDLYTVTSRRDNFLIRPKAYYLDVWQQFLQATPKQAELLLAYVDQIPVAGLILFYFHQTAWYMYGASSGQHRNLMPNHLLQWEAIKAAQAAGCTRYDMWGAPNTFDESDSMWGVYRFKMGFGGVTRQGLGAYDYPVHSFQYTLFNHILPKIQSILRRS